MSLQIRKFGFLAAAALALVALVIGGPQGVRAAACDATVAPAYAGTYTCNDIGAVPDLPESYGGLTILPSDTNTLLIGGDANTANGKIYAVTVTRGVGGHITGFSGGASVFADGAYNDGGVVFGPGGVLFLARWNINQVGQTKPASAITDKTIDGADFGIPGDSSISALNFVPSGFPGAGQLKIVTYSGGSWYTVNYAADGSGTYNLTGAVLNVTLPGGPEGFTYVPPGSPVFPANSMLLSEYGDDNIATYTLDANGNPVVASRADFITDLTGAEGAAIDPVTGDFLFSTFGNDVDHVIAVQGFSIPPTPGPTNTPQATPTTCQDQEEVPCTATPTSVTVRKNVATRTPTPAPSATASVATVAASPTHAPQVVLSSPSSGAAGAAIAPPDTGSGGENSGQRALGWFELISLFGGSAIALSLFATLYRRRAR